MTEAGLEESLGRLSALKRFPSNPLALVEIAETLRELCPTDDDAARLIRGVMRTHDEWCGPLGLRKTCAQIKAVSMYVPWEEYRKQRGF